MAEEINLIVNVEAGDGKKTVADVRNELEQAKKSATEAKKTITDAFGEPIKTIGGLKDRLKELNSQLEKVSQDSKLFKALSSEAELVKSALNGTTNSTASLKAQLKAMKAELLGLDEGSERFKKLSRDAAELEDRIGDVNARVKALSSDTKRLDALVGIGTGIAAGFQAAQGAMALFGSDSKKVEEAIKNVIAVQGILNGVQTIANLLQKENIVGQYARIAAEKLGILTTNEATGAQLRFNMAMLANPVFLIIAGFVALGAAVLLVIKYYDKLVQIFNVWSGIYDTQAIREAEIADREQKQRAERGKAHQERLNQIQKETEARIKSADENIAALQLEKETLDAQGKSSEEVTIKILEAEKEKTLAVLNGNREKIQSWIDYYSTEMALSGQSAEDFKATMKGRGIDLELLQQKADELIKQNEANVQRSENAITKFKREQHEKRVEAAQKEQAELDRLRKEEEERLKKEAEAQAEFDQMILDRRLEADRLFNERLEKEKQERFDREFDMLEEQIDRENALKEQQEQAERDRLSARQKIAENFSKASISLSETVFKITNALGKQDEESRLKRAKRQFEVSKALSIAEATISTINGVVNALTEKSMLPSPISTIVKAANAIAVGAAGAANIAKIASQKFEGGGSGGAVTSVGGGDIGSAMSQTGEQEPKANPVNYGSTLLNQEPQKVYVLESDITKTQKKVSAIESKATFG